MIQLSNLRLEDKNGWTYLICDCKAPFAKEEELWYAVPDEYKHILSDEVYDAFLVTMLYPAMFYKEDIVIEGCVTEKLYRNIMTYVQALLKDFSPDLTSVDVRINGFSTITKTDYLVGTGFSGGVDSFTTFYDHFENETNPAYRINVFFFANTGQHGNYYDESTLKRFDNRYRLLKRFPEEKGLPYIKLNSNVFAYYREDWHLKNGSLRRVSAVIVCQKVLAKYYVSSTYGYKEMMFYGPNTYNHALEDYADPYLLPLLSPEGLDIIPDGSQYTRVQKTQRIADYPATRKYLNVCIRHSDNDGDAKNCSSCDKCLRTLMTLESMDALDRFAGVFDLSVYKKHSFAYKCLQRVEYHHDAFAKENVDFAVFNHKPVPPRFFAYLVCMPTLAKRAAKKLLGEKTVRRLKEKLKNGRAHR